MLNFAHGPAGTHGGHRDAFTGSLLATYRNMRCAALTGGVRPCI
jgi:hypothetical protein